MDKESKDFILTTFVLFFSIFAIGFMILGIISMINKDKAAIKFCEDRGMEFQGRSELYYRCVSYSYEGDVRRQGTSKFIVWDDYKKRGYFSE